MKSRNLTLGLFSVLSACPATLLAACGGEIIDVGADATVIDATSDDAADVDAGDAYKCPRPDAPTCAFCVFYKGCLDAAPEDVRPQDMPGCEAGEQCLHRGVLFQCCDPCIKPCN